MASPLDRLVRRAPSGRVLKLISCSAALVLACALGGCRKKAGPMAAGGTRITLSLPGTGSAEERSTVRRLLEKRITNSHRISYLTEQGSDLLLDVPMSEDVSAILRLVRRVGRMQLVAADKESLQLSLRQPLRARAIEAADARTLELTLQAEDRERFEKLVRLVEGKPLLLQLDGTTLARVTVKPEEAARPLRIDLPAISSRSREASELGDLLAMLEGGALPLPVTVELQEAISPQR
jgi:preprotein translocase subunit SecD